MKKGLSNPQPKMAWLNSLERVQARTRMLIILMIFGSLTTLSFIVLMFLPTNTINLPVNTPAQDFWAGVMFVSLALMCIVPFVIIMVARTRFVEQWMHAQHNDTLPEIKMEKGTAHSEAGIIEPSAPVVGRVFISYRRQDTSHLAGRLYDRLVDHFGETQVFMDVDSIEPGADFPEALRRAVSTCNGATSPHRSPMAHCDR